MKGSERVCGEYYEHRDRGQNDGEIKARIKEPFKAARWIDLLSLS